MAIDTSLSGWLDELQHAEASIKPYLESMIEDKKAYMGRAFRTGEGRMAPENHALEWFALMRGQLLMGNPAVRWTSMLDGDAQARAAALTMATNQVSKRLMMRNVNEQLLMDFGFKWAVCLVKNTPAPGFSDIRATPKWPGVYRISPNKFRYDPAADRADARAWSAHLVIGSRRALIDLAADPASGWDRSAIEKLDTQNVAKFRDVGSKIPERDEVAYWEIWCPEEELDDSPGKSKGYHGTIYTVADNQSIDIGWLRKPTPAFVPPWGPYIVGGDYLVPDESATMGPITASSQQAHFVNRTKRATIEAIEAYKRLIFVTDPKVAEAVKTGVNDWVYAMECEDIRNKVLVSEIGGATQQHFAAEESAQGALDKVSGITDLMRGNVDPRNKATQDALAAQSSANRASGTVSKFYDIVTRYLYTVGYFIDIDDEVEIELGPQAAGQFVDAKGNPTTRLKGGRHPTQDPEEFFNLDLELRVGSMERSLEMDTQMQLQVMAQTMQEVATLGPATALYADWQGYLDAKAELTGIPIIKRLVNVPALMQVSQAMMQAGMQQPEGQGGAGQAGGGSAPKASYSGNPGSRSLAASLPDRMAAKATGVASSSSKAAWKLSQRPKALDAGRKAG
jgi:hypothetical protein